jgi:hypothetical protein
VTCEYSLTIQKKALLRGREELMLVRVSRCGAKSVGAVMVNGNPLISLCEKHLVYAEDDIKDRFLVRNPYNKPHDSRCLRCGHSWARRVDNPIICPNPGCKSPYWNIPRKRGCVLSLIGSKGTRCEPLAIP